MDVYWLAAAFLAGVAVGLAVYGLLTVLDDHADRRVEQMVAEALDAAPNELLPLVDALCDDRCETCDGLITDDNRAPTCDAHDLCTDCAPHALCFGCKAAEREVADAYSTRWL